VALVVGAVILARGKPSARPPAEEIVVPATRVAPVTSPPLPSAVVTAPTPGPTKPQDTPPKHASVAPRGEKPSQRAEAERPATSTTRVRESKRGSLIDRL
jgi:hypothetical protein